MENLQNTKIEKNVEVKDAKEVKDVKISDKIVSDVKEVTKEKRLEDMLDESQLLIQDDEFKTTIAYKKLSELTDEDKKKFAKGILKAEIKKTKDKKSSYIHLSLMLADNVVLQDSLTTEKSLILKELRPEIIGAKTEVLVKLVSMLPVKNKKENPITGEISYPRAYTCVAPICEGVVFNGGYSTDRFNNNKKTSKAYLRNDTIILIKIHNAKHPESKVQFYDIGEVGEDEDSSVSTI